MPATVSAAAPRRLGLPGASPAALLALAVVRRTAGRHSNGTARNSVTRPGLRSTTMADPGSCRLGLAVRVTSRSRRGSGCGRSRRALRCGRRGTSTVPAPPRGRTCRRPPSRRWRRLSQRCSRTDRPGPPPPSGGQRVDQRGDDVERGPVDLGVRPERLVAGVVTVEIVIRVPRHGRSARRPRQPRSARSAGSTGCSRTTPFIHTFGCARTMGTITSPSNLSRSYRHAVTWGWRRAQIGEPGLVAGQVHHEAGSIDERLGPAHVRADPRIGHAVALVGRGSPVVPELHHPVGHELSAGHMASPGTDEVEPTRVFGCRARCDPVIASGHRSRRSVRWLSGVIMQ